MMGTAFFGDSGFESSANDEWQAKNKAERQNFSTNRQHSFESGVFIARQHLSPQSKFSRRFNCCVMDLQAKKLEVDGWTSIIRARETDQWSQHNSAIGLCGLLWFLLFCIWWFLRDWSDRLASCKSKHSIVLRCWPSELLVRFFTLATAIKYWSRNELNGWDWRIEKFEAFSKRLNFSSLRFASRTVFASRGTRRSIFCPDPLSGIELFAPNPNTPNSLPFESLTLWNFGVFKPSF